MKCMDVLKMIRSDWETHGRDWTRPGFRALAIHRFGVWRMSVSPKPIRVPFSLVYRYLYRKVRNHYGIEIPYTASIGQRVCFEHQHGIVVHGNAVIGDDCVVRQGVTIGNRYLDKPYDAPQIGSGVNIGAGAKILGAVKIGDRAIIGANAVVLNDVPDGALAVGVPARIKATGNPHSDD